MSLGSCQQWIRAPILAFICVLVAACTVTWVSSYDQGFVDGVSNFHEQAATMLVKLEEEGTAGTYDKYANDYGKLLASLDVLLVRAMVSAEKIDKFGAEAQLIINKAVSDATGGDRSQFENLSLRAAHIVDLRALIFKWQMTHKQEPQKSGVWTHRRASLARAVTAVLTFERAKE